MKCIAISGGCAIVVTALIAQACSSPQVDDNSQSSTDQVGQAIAADWIHPACDASALGPLPADAQACSAPVTYSYREFTQCGTTCFALNSCQSWDLNSPGDGVGYTVQSSTESSSVVYRYTVDQSGISGSFPEDVCPQSAVIRRNQLLATRPGISMQAASGFTVDWATVNETVIQGGDPRGEDFWLSWRFSGWIQAAV